MRASIPQFKRDGEVELEVIKCNQLTPGDVVLAWSLVKNSPSEWTGKICAEGPYTVAETDETGVVWATSIHGQRSRLVHTSGTYWMFIVARQTSKESEDFPHSCPLCGNQAYVGLVNISHATIGSCPDR
jgi:hypothetical protein